MAPRHVVNNACGFVQPATFSRTANALLRNRCVLRTAHMRSRANGGVVRNIMRAEAERKNGVTILRDAQKVYSADKPPWCQPWTIIGTGIGTIAASWTICGGWTRVFAGAITGAVVLWWYVFLVVYPQSVVDE